ncbi:MAG: hypothetical protein KGL61_13395 [Burkholderiales bacterium]|nr:hypothetical protein [Burkholderiales bacterium]
MKGIACGVATSAMAIANCAHAQQHEFKQLSGPQIRAELSGKYATDDTHWSHRYLPGGTLIHTERGKQAKGRWAVRGNQLCIADSEKAPANECFDVFKRNSDIEFRDKGIPFASGRIRSQINRAD